MVMTESVKTTLEQIERVGDWLGKIEAIVDQLNIDLGLRKGLLTGYLQKWSIFSTHLNTAITYYTISRDMLFKELIENE